MKGPGLRVDLDVRRVWQCPRCGKQRRELGDVASVTCYCHPDETFMRLLEPQRLVKKFPHPPENYATSLANLAEPPEDAAADSGSNIPDVQRSVSDETPAP